MLSLRRPKVTILIRQVLREEPTIVELVKENLPEITKVIQGTCQSRGEPAMHQFPN
jgi:hypothetical protein